VPAPGDRRERVRGEPRQRPAPKKPHLAPGSRYRPRPIWFGGLATRTVTHSARYFASGQRRILALLLGLPALSQLRVAGSNPVSRSRIYERSRALRSGLSSSCRAVGSRGAMGRAGCRSVRSPTASCRAVYNRHVPTLMDEHSLRLGRSPWWVSSSIVRRASRVSRAGPPRCAGTWARPGAPPRARWEPPGLAGRPSRKPSQLGSCAAPRLRSSSTSVASCLARVRGSLRKSRPAMTEAMAGTIANIHMMPRSADSGCSRPPS